MQDPMAMAQAMMALRQQAEGWMEAYRTSLLERRLGFTDDDLAFLEEAARAAPAPPAESAEANAATVAEMTRRANETVYPEQGLAPDDPRLAPIDGVTLVEQAMCARAIGWSTDPAVTERVLPCLGIDAAAWQSISEVWQKRVADDLVLGALYGQLFIAADPLPRRP